MSFVLIRHAGDFFLLFLSSYCLYAFREQFLRDHVARGAAGEEITCLTVYAFTGSLELPMVKCALDMLQRSTVNDIQINTVYQRTKRKFAKVVSEMRSVTLGVPPAYIPEQSEGVLLLLGCENEKVRCIQPTFALFKLTHVLAPA